MQEFPFPCLSGGGGYRVVLYLPCPQLNQLVGSILAEKYADAAVYVARSERGHHEPAWLVAGHAHYVYARWMAAAGLQPYRTFRSEMIGFARATDLALDSGLLNIDARDLGAPLAYIIDSERPLWELSRRQFQQSIGALAIDWLVSRTGEAALEQYAQTRFAGDWRAAFHDAFGMSVDQFTRGFEQYRADVAAADGGAPRLSRPLHHVVFSVR